MRIFTQVGSRARLLDGRALGRGVTEPDRYLHLPVQQLPPGLQGHQLVVRIGWRQAGQRFPGRVQLAARIGEFTPPPGVHDAAQRKPAGENVVLEVGNLPPENLEHRPGLVEQRRRGRVVSGVPGEQVPPA